MAARTITAAQFAAQRDGIQDEDDGDDDAAAEGGLQRVASGKVGVQAELGLQPPPSAERVVAAGERYRRARRTVEDLKMQMKAAKADMDLAHLLWLSLNTRLHAEHERVAGGY